MMTAPMDSRLRRLPFSHLLPALDLAADHKAGGDVDRLDISSDCVQGLQRHRETVRGPCRWEYTSCEDRQPHTTPIVTGRCRCCRLDPGW
ncbi:hypothetical protein XENOCAPTIV_011408 [Xenoophorus captivus]|uniref:Uncharacterized protein n=1 Tax=Xenoophorus captivus TaxID=1517983 RepID=A0ABV0QR87_9TELE